MHMLQANATRIACVLLHSNCSFAPNHQDLEAAAPGWLPAEDIRSLQEPPAFLVGWFVVSDHQAS
jgi:hypothetical protein